MPQENMKHLMLIRFSALGDILMTVPVVEALARQYPEVKITMVSRPFVGSIFSLLPDNVHFVSINPKNYPGPWGLYRLFRELKAMKPTVMCDLHDVLRTQFIRTCMQMCGIKVSHIIKNRRSRKKFISQQSKQQQKTSFEKYAEALEKAGFPIELSVCPKPHLGKAGVGIAPFAAHKGKIYPLEMMEEVVRMLSEKGIKVFLFGAGEKEKAVTEAWAEKYKEVESMVGKLKNMAEEANFISSLNVMLTMDSGNMHLASLTSTPVISIWGATHPLGGFLGWGQSLENVLQIEDLKCRPCSTFGNKPCKMGDYPCLHRIKPESVVEKVMEKCR